MLNDIIYIYIYTNYTTTGCGQEPDIIIVDGYQLVLPAEFIKNLDIPTKTSSQSPVYHFDYGDTSFISNKHKDIASLLSKYCGKTVSSKEPDIGVITEAEMQVLMVQLQCHYPVIYNIIQNFPNEEDNIVAILVRILKVLCYREHIGKLLPSSLIDSIGQLLISNKLDYPTSLSTMFGASPLLNSLLLACKTKHQYIPQYIKDFLLALKVKVQMVRKEYYFPDSLLADSSVEQDYRYGFK